MIPAFSHCRDCGCPPSPIRPLWSDSDDVIGWWCQTCKLLVLVDRD